MNAVTGASATLAHSANPADTIETQPAERNPSEEFTGGGVDHAKWEFNNRKTLLYALVGNDFGPDPGFIHFNFFDITLYLRQLFDVLMPGGLFVFGMSDTDSLNINTDKYFGVVLEKYKENRRSPVLMHWNSATAVCRAAQTIGFQARVACRSEGSAMVLLEKPVYPGLRPERETRIRRRMTKVAQLYAHASQQIINLQSTPSVAEAACDAVVRRLCLGLWRFIGIKGNN
jgi:hypothetical protein